MRARLTRDESGWALVTAIVLMVVMLGVGLALLAVVDTQTSQSRTQRITDSSFNLAEGVQNADAFLLSHAWPELSSQTPSGTTAPCGSQTLTGTLATSGLPAGVAGRIQSLAAQTYTGGDYVNGATWKVNVCDDTNGATWSDAMLSTAPAYDANGPDANGIRRMWVRAQATVRGRSRAVVGLVQVSPRPALPGKYAVLGGGFTSDVSTITSSAVLKPLTSGLLGGKQMYAPDPSDPTSGRLGIRCDALADTDCLTASVLGALDQTVVGGLLTSNNIVRYQSPTAVSDDVVANFRRQAQATGTYFPSLSDGAACLPAGGAPGKIVFVERIGTDGNGTCKITSTATAKMLVVGSGRVRVIGGATKTASVAFNGVIYDLFGQASQSGVSNHAVVSIENWATVNGAVYIDGAGKLQVTPPQSWNLNALISSLPLCNGLTALVCSTLTALLDVTNVNNLVTQLTSGQVCATVLLVRVCLPAMTPAQVAGGLLQQLNGWGPAVQETDSAVRAVTTYGSSGTVQGTFREIPPN